MFAATSSFSGTGYSVRQVAAAAFAFAAMFPCSKPWALPHTGADGLNLKLSMSLRVIPETTAQASLSPLESIDSCVHRHELPAQGADIRATATLQQSVERARRNNPEIARALAQLRKAQAEVDNAGSAYSPQIRLSASSGTNGPGSGRLASAANAQLSKLLHDFGKTDGLIEEAQKRKEARIQEERDTVNRITMDIVEAWLNTARQSEMARLHQQASAALEEAVRILRLRAEAGLVGAGDVDLAQARLAQIRAAGMSACLQREQLLSRLSMLTGGPVDPTSQDMPPPLTGNGPTSAWDPSTLPSVRQAEAEHQAAVNHVQSVKASRWPSLYLQAARTTNRQPDSTSNIYLTLSMDVLEAGTDSRIDSASAEVQSARLRVQSVREAADDSFRRYHAELRSIDMRRPLLESQALSTAATRRTFMEQFLAGRRQVLDLLNTHQEVLAADVALASLRFDRMVLVARLHGLHDELPELIAFPADPRDLPAPSSADAETTLTRIH